MCTVIIEMLTVLQNEMPAIVAGGAFGKNVVFVSFEQNKDLVGKDQYQSTVIFGTVTTSDGSHYEVLFKLKLRDAIERGICQSNEQFHNEITMYETIIPFLLAHRGSTVRDKDALLLPRYFYGRNRCGEFTDSDMIILENVVPLGYRLSEERIFLDYDHLKIALQALAKFHALSYTAKHENHVKFRKIIVDIYDTFLRPDNFLTSKNALLKFGKRGVDRLLERSGDMYQNHEHLRQFNELIRNGEDTIRRALQPREPWSVMGHGDFNRNNVMFRYDDTGSPAGVLLFDFGTPRYGSPALDLSFFLYINTTQTVRHSRWDDLLDAYCTALVAAVPSGIRVPNRAELDSEMATSGVFGLEIASFFQPFLLDVVELPLDHTFSHDQKLDLSLKYGGDAATERVADMVQHFIDVGYSRMD